MSTSPQKQAATIAPPPNGEQEFDDTLLLSSTLHEFDEKYRSYVTDGESFNRLAEWFAEVQHFDDKDYGHDEGRTVLPLEKYIENWGAALRKPAKSSTNRVRDVIENAVSPRYRAQLNHNRSLSGFPAIDGLGVLDDAALSFDPLIGEMFSQLSPLEDSREGEYAAQAGSTILQVAQTTVLAISVLLRNGYVLDAVARWRGLHELVCTANLIASSPDPDDCARRYLVHGRFVLPDRHLSQSEKATPAPEKKHWLDVNHGWLKADYPQPGNFTQKFMFEKLGSPACIVFSKRWIQDGHSTVHMSSEAVSWGRIQRGGAPAGWSPGMCREYTVAVLYSLGAVLPSVMELSLVGPYGSDPESTKEWYGELRRQMDILTTRALSLS